MLSNQKRKWLRILAVVIVLAVVIGVVSIGSAVGKAGVQTLMKAAAYDDYSDFLLSDRDAANRAGFTSLDPVGAPYIKAAENDSLILYYYTTTYADPRLLTVSEDAGNAAASGGTGSDTSSNTSSEGGSAVVASDVYADDTQASAYSNENPNLGTTGYIENVMVYDKRSGQRWSAIQTDRQLLDSGLTDTFYFTMQSIVTFRYIDLVRGSGKKDQKSVYTYVTPHEMTVEAIKSGIRFNYVFSQLNISFAVDFALDGSDFTIKMPNELISEEEEASEGYTENKSIVTDDCNEIAEICTSFADAEDQTAVKTAITNLNSDIDSAILTIKDKLGTGSSITTYVDTISSKIDMIETFVQNEEQIARLRELVAEISAKTREISNYRSTGMTEMELAPYFGSQRSSSGGYAFYPDNNGAISYFHVLHPEMSGEYSQVVYDEHSPEQRVYSDKVEIKTAATYLNAAKYPVFGIRADQSAFLAVITDGDYDSAITYVPLRKDIDVASIYATFYMRKGTKKLTTTGGQSFLYDTLRTKQDWAIRYRMLDPQSSDYSGMAVSYRSYLTSTGRLNVSSLMEQSAPPLGLEFFMGANSSQQSVFSDYVVMTRFSDILATLQKLESQGVSNAMVSVTDWQQDNNKVYPADPVPASQIGGKDGLKELAAYMKERGEMLSLQDSYVWIKQADVSSSLINVAAVKMKSLISFESYGWYMLNPTYIYNHLLDARHGQIAEYYQDYGVSGLTLGGISGSLYFDYNQDAPAERRDTAMLFAATAQQTRSRLGFAAGSYANAFLYSGLDWNMSLEYEGSGYSFTDEDVPFLPIVLHGYMAYTGSGYNYFYDNTVQRLKEIEYGYLPYYYLTKEEPFEIRNIGYTGFYSTVIDSWTDRIADEYNQYNRDFYDVWNATILSHKNLSDTLAETVYQTKDGRQVEVYVNYSGTDVSVSGGTVGAESYLVVR